MSVLISLSDCEGILGVFATELPKEVDGHPGPLVAQAWHSKEPVRAGLPVWVVPMALFGHPPLMVTSDHDKAMQALKAFSAVGAAPSESNVDVWRLEVGSLTPPAKRRMEEHRRVWTDEERARAQSHFKRLVGAEMSDPGRHIPGSVADLIVDAPVETDSESKSAEVP